SSKRLDLLHELVPNAAVIAVLVNPNNANAELELNEIQVAARTLGSQLVVAQASTEREIDAAFENLVQRHAAALFVAGDAYFNNNRRDQIAALAARHALPTSSASRENVVAGMLMGYGANREDSSRQWGRYVGRVLKGEKP